MNHAPKPTAIYAAELRVLEAKQSAQNSLQRARSAFRANLVKPSTLLLLTGSAGVAGFLLMRGTRQKPVAVAQAAAPPTLAGVALAFIVRYAVRYLPFFLEQGRQAFMRRSNPIARRPPTSSM